MLTHARDSGARVDDAELDRAVGQRGGAEPDDAGRSCASGCAQRGHRLRALSRQPARPDADRAGARARGARSASASATPRSTSCIEKQRGAAAGDVQIQHRADPGHGARRRQRRPWWPSAARAPRRRWRACAAGEDFAAVAREISEDGNRGQRRRDRPAAGRPPARRVRRGRAPAASPARSRRACCAAAPAFTCSSCSNAASGAAFRVHADARPPHPAAPVAAAERARPRSAGWPSSSARSKPARAASSTWRARTREDGSAAQGGDLGWASPGPFVPEFEEAMNRPAGRRHLRSGGVALRRAPDPGGRAAQSRRSTPSSCASRRATSCASRSSRRPTRNGCATCAPAPTSSCASRRSERRRTRREATSAAQALRPALPGRRRRHRRDRRRDRPAARRGAGRDRPRASAR